MESRGGRGTVSLFTQVLEASPPENNYNKNTVTTKLLGVWFKPILIRRSNHYF